MIFENIRSRCKEKGISISRLEKEAGLGNGTIGGWAYSSPRVSSVEAVAKVLDCAVEDIIK